MWIEKHRDTYRIRDERGDKKITLKSGLANKTVAKRLLNKLREERDRGDSLVVRGGQITLNAFLDSWWPRHEKSLKPTTVHSEGGRVRNHIRPLLGMYKLDDLDSVVIDEWVELLGAGVDDPDPKRRRKPLAPKTIHNCHGILHTIMAAAVKEKRIRINPCSGDNLPRREPKEMMHLSDPEMARLIAALPPHWRPLVMLLLGTGLRWGEAIGLKAGRIDLLARPPKLVVLEQMQEMSGTGELVFQSPKTTRSRRTVTFTKELALVLTRLVANREKGELIFLTPTGLPIRTRNFRRVWLTAVAKAGLTGFRVHDTRHTHAALLIAAGRQMTAISRRLGHSSIAVTDVLYGHLRPEVDEGILTAIQEAMSLISEDDLGSEVADELALDEVA